MAKVKALVIVGYGLNCEAETHHVLELAGARVERIHLNDLIEDKGRRKPQAPRQDSRCRSPSTHTAAAGGVRERKRALRPVQCCR